MLTDIKKGDTVYWVRIIPTINKGEVLVLKVLKIDSNGLLSATDDETKRIYLLKVDDFALYSTFAEANNKLSEAVESGVIKVKKRRGKKI